MKKIPSDSVLKTYGLKRLLEIVEELFKIKIRKQSSFSIIDYSLDKFPGGWRFSVTNSWQKWMQLNNPSEFGLYAHPENAVIEFLRYVRNNKIIVTDLMEK